MKKNLIRLSVLSLIFFAVACSSSKKSSSLRAGSATLKGDWEITNIEVNLPIGYKVTEAFGTAPYQDFQDSHWTLKRNGNGSFSLSDGTTQRIYWSWTQGGLEGQITFKKLEDGEKPKNVTSGYILDLYDLSANSFQGIAKINVDATKTGTIVYTFSRQ